METPMDNNRNKLCGQKPRLATGGVERQTPPSHCAWAAATSTLLRKRLGVGPWAPLGAFSAWRGRMPVFQRRQLRWQFAEGVDACPFLNDVS